MFDSQFYHLNYSTVKARGVDEGNCSHTLVVHKMPVRKSGYESAEILKERYYSEDSDSVTLSEERFASSISRSKQNIIQLVANNEWEYFVTLTISPESDADRYNLKECKSKVLEYFSNYSRRSGASTRFKYVLIPEFHKDGAVHFHGVMKGINPGDLVINQNGYFDFVPYCKRFGFCNMAKIRDLQKCASYISKYVSKDMFIGKSMESGTHLYCASKGLKKDRVLMKGSCVVDLKDFLEQGYDGYENDYCTKIDFGNDKESALSCLAPFQKEFAVGINIPCEPLSTERKEYLRNRAVIKYCNHFGIPVGSASIDSIWNDIMNNYSYVLNEYDLFKHECTAEKVSDSILNGFAWLEDARRVKTHDYYEYIKRFVLGIDLDLPKFEQLILKT